MYNYQFSKGKNLIIPMGVQWRGGGNGHKYSPELPPPEHLPPLSILNQNVHPLTELVESSIFFALFAPQGGGKKIARAQIFALPGQRLDAPVCERACTMFVYIRPRQVGCS